MELDYVARECLNKRQYTLKEAREMVNFFGSRGFVRRKSQRRLYFYQCPHCNGWHLTKRREWHDASANR